MKKSVVSLHIKSAKHGAGIGRLAAKDKRERNIAEMLKQYDKTTSFWRIHVRVYRVRVLTNFLKAGVPLEKIDIFRDILEEN